MDEDAPLPAEDGTTETTPGASRAASVARGPDVSGRVVVVTGASKGIGRRTAAHFLERGDLVHGCARSPSPIEHPAYVHHRLDVADEAAVKAMMSAIRRAHGRIDVLINAAGEASMNHALLTPAETLEALLRTNVIGSFVCAREAARLMRPEAHRRDRDAPADTPPAGGRIVNLTSVAVPLKLAGAAAYAAAKAAVESLTQTLARELAPMGIAVNAVGPGPVRTRMTRTVPPETIDRLLSAQTVSRLATTDEVVRVIDFLADPAAAMVTGQIIYLGGVSR
ncbi:SDR family NAD(P)-dependent oxidoreductase [Tistrella mobilis]|uniref:Short-chain dehydrogenase/reductase SDR n=1 Tax=Tistrella mobilis (strain KA081020-065) TaxID=1110502 RepID=I3TI51_TISMK|nr:SDR family oxidoreductase [Tistrella mobilis]AFK52439.1 short-chain dehydrogenase/reductase SDR [Tistrella mobilis KA081020-065]